MPSKIHVQATINGQPAEFLCEPRQSLLEVLRDILGLTGTKEGCNDGNCGACTVMMDGRIVNSCLVLGAEIQGSTITTIEGIACGTVTGSNLYAQAVAQVAQAVGFMPRQQFTRHLNGT